ncbi:MAG TPA: hypothetical protein VM100_07125 [Longimicrobiales bacterium]|nr:hypothetical protein [Longimicrobiales bacterium]
MRYARIVVFCLALNPLALAAEDRGVIMLAAEPIQFDQNLRPRFTENQIMNTAPATRAGLARWSATQQGRALLAYFTADEYLIAISEDSSEEGLGRAPQPGLATLVAARNHARSKVYDLVLNPVFFRMPRDMRPMPDQPSTPADMMAVAWAAEMLHIYYYSQGISLPHHERPDFQRRWRSVARQLGLPMVTHDDER